MPKYPDIQVKLTGTDRKVPLLISRCVRAMTRADVPGEEIDAFFKEAEAATDWKLLVSIVSNWVDLD
jgi:hypothetical protein